MPDDASWESETAFVDAAVDAVPPAILYRFFDAEERLLYVGITVVGAARWAYHALYQPWWKDVVTVRVAHFPDIEAAAEAERDAIRAERPMHNRIFAGPIKPIKARPYRRHWRSGTVYQRQGDGRWVASVRRDGRRIVRYAKDRDDALAKLAELQPTVSA